MPTLTLTSQSEDDDVTFHQQEAVYGWQVYLHALKQCEMCGVWQRVHEFGGWGFQPCSECTAQQQRHKRAWRYKRAWR